MQALRSGSPHSWSLRWHLTFLIGGTLLPLVAFSALVVLQLAGEMQHSIERRLQRSAHVMSASFEREVAATVRTLQALAESASLERDDLEGFRAEAFRVKRTQPSWLTVLLLTPDGRQVVNLNSSLDRPLRSATEPESVRKVIETRQPVVGRIAQSPISHEWAFPIRVPVMREGQLRYVLTAVIPPRALAEVVTHQQPAEEGEFTRTMVDSEGLIVFRTRDPERFIGKAATTGFLQNILASTEGVFRSVTLEGTPSYVAFSRSTLSGWTSAVVVPSGVIDGPFWRSIWAIAATGALAILLSAGGGLIFARRFARGIRSVAEAADALANGEEPRMAPSAIKEVDRAGRSLVVSAERLRQHAAEEQRAREGLEEAVRARDEFLSLASHELKTPLTSLMLQTQLVQRRLERNEPLAREAVGRQLDQTARQTQRLARLVNDMLDISRISAGKLALEWETFDLDIFAREVVTKLGPQMSEARCDVSIQSMGAVVGTWDRYRLEQVLTNLLTNAARYGAGEPVEVSVGQREREAVLRVRDHGRGIDPADHERIFRKFERAVDAHEVSGLGLGLFIVREIVEMHGGAIQVESALGQGATFVVVLPLREPVGLGDVSKESLG
ncbi:sensor histidine kinase [Hyalangium versicolor]|uniref:sensor histidine kinase n=1 Tax=Hyalangium versicolor TaxID=2861190 RepID=UPI001CCD239D|nr:sensor histidine kinase [Hyalangium versicolor]